MKRKHDLRVYLDLFCGPGKAQIKGTQRIVFTSPLLAMNVRDPFNLYILCDHNPENISALQLRTKTHFSKKVVANFVVGDCNTQIEKVIESIPLQSPNQSVLCFCFLDPFNLGIHFATVKKLASASKIDFLILLATQMDGARNYTRYVQRSNATIDLFLEDSEWREKWSAELKMSKEFSMFLIEKFTRKMITRGFRGESFGSMVTVKNRRNTPLYRLAFLSREGLAYRFWEEVRKYVLNELPFEE